MKIQLRNLGPLRQAEFELGDMTVICGHNNTGKTYATYALYGWLDYWNVAYNIGIRDEAVEELLEKGNVTLDLGDFINRKNEILKAASKSYTDLLPRVFASSERLFENSSIKVELIQSDIKPMAAFERTIGALKTQIFRIKKEEGENTVVISLLVDKTKVELPPDVIRHSIGSAIKTIVFAQYFPEPFIASAERTGAAIFRKELDFARNRLLEELKTTQGDLDPFSLLNKVFTSYALPVRRNVDFTRQLEDVGRQESYISKNHPGILSYFSNIIGGEYIVKREGIFFAPYSSRGLRLTMTESSSSVRSLLDVGFYLRHVAQPGNLLMIDEPELNLHPENQRRIARLFARLINEVDIKVFITTHSDYILKELNTLIMLNNKTENTAKVKSLHRYEDNELLSAEKLRVYIAKPGLVKLNGNYRRSRVLTLVKANIDGEVGIEADSFDRTINEMNRIQRRILFGA